MKSGLVITLVLIFLLGCSKQEPAQMTAQEQEVVRKEIRNVIKGQITALEKADTHAYLSCTDSSQFLAFGNDGTLMDTQALKEHMHEIFKVIASVRYSIVKDEFKFLAHDVVLYASFGKIETLMKSGTITQIDSFGRSVLFKRSTKGWQIIYEHNSNSAPVEIKAGKQRQRN